MLDGLYNVRPSERRDVWLAFAVLASFLGAFAMLETARDALFLAKIDAARLPWMYLAIAMVSLALPAGRRGLSMTLGAVAIGTAVFFVIVSGGAGPVYGLYVWTGVVSTLVLARFWTLLGELFSLTQAKRVYGFIGIGSVLGAMAGSGAASLITRAADPRYLLLMAAGGFLFAAGLASRLCSSEEPAKASIGLPAESKGVAELLWRHPYAKRVAMITLLAACALTLADFLFKQALSRSVPARELGPTVASAYFGLNVLSLLVQVFLVGFVIRRLGLLAALGVLPLLLVLSGGMMIGIGGLIGALAIKGPDGALRHTLHRTATELLFVPLPCDLRRRLKAFIDVVGQRGGQALASALILVLLAAKAPPWVMALALVAACTGWLALIYATRIPYLDVFRSQLRPGSLLRAEALPELDVRSLETLVAALDGADDQEVIASLDMLDRLKKGRLVPALTLYHPSAAVVERALCLFSRTGRTNALHIIDRLLSHDAPRVRSSAVAARSAIAHDCDLLSSRLAVEDSFEVVATLRANLIAAGDLPGEGLNALLASGGAAAGRATAQAIARHRAVAHSSTLVRLTVHLDTAVRIAAARAIVALYDGALVGALVPLLADDATRAEAEEALLSFGELGLRALGATLTDRSVGASVLWHVPRAIRKFDHSHATPVLEAGLRDARDGMVRYRIIRALEETIANHPAVSLDRELLTATLFDTVRRTFTFLSRRVALERGVALDRRRATEGHELLLTFLRDKERHAIGRVFRLLGLLHPREDFAAIHASLMGGEREARASSIELIENLLAAPLRQAVVGLIDEQPAHLRLRAGFPFLADEPADYEGALDRLLASDSESIVDITVYHVGELGLTGFRDRLDRLTPRPDVTLALARLAGSQREASHAA